MPDEPSDRAGIRTKVGPTLRQAGAGDRAGVHPTCLRGAANAARADRHGTAPCRLYLRFIGFRKAARFECILQANLQKWPHWHSPVSRTGLEIER
jgi:hypothetical protein